MRLSRLLSLVPAARPSHTDDGRDPDIAGVAIDSRQVRPGMLFAALRGGETDGRLYIGAALQAGAAAILLEDAAPPDGVDLDAAGAAAPLLFAADPARIAAEAADVLCGHPATRLSLVGITGTNGKTTTAYILRHLLRACGRPCGMLGTIEYDDGRRSAPAPLTTPDAPAFTRALADMADNGCVAAVAEASSHALAQGRTHPHRFAVAVFTNLTRDHLDYHRTMDAYAEAKRGLFAGLDAAGTAVVNADDPYAASMLEHCRARRFAYTLEDAPPPAPGTAMFRAGIDRAGRDGTAFSVTDTAEAEGAAKRRIQKYFLPLVGRHNVCNALGAILAARALGLGDGEIAAALAGFPGVPGRLERVLPPDADRGRQAPTAFVDFAHTDDALRTVLATLRPLTNGKLWVVFGCGGGRDPGKRPLMAKAAENGADRVVVTSDNPRAEDPEAIIRDIMAGFARPCLVQRQPDRAAAVALAMREAAPDDIVLVAGKGHETYQIVGGNRYHMDDRELIQLAISNEQLTV